MMPTHPHRRRGLFVAALVAAAFTVGMLPPAFGDETPPTVLEDVDIPASALANSGQDVQAAGGTLRSEDGGWTRSHRVCGDITFTSAAVAWRQTGGHDADDEHGGHEVHVSLRWGDEESLGPAFRTVALADEMPDPGEGRGVIATPVVWTGEARCLEVRLEVPEDAQLRDVEVTMINASGTATRHTLLGSLAAGFRGAMGRIWGVSSAEAQPSKPAIIKRSGWGANGNRRNQWPGCDSPQYANRLKMAYVHHTVNGNSYSKSQADDLMRSIYEYHTSSSLKYCDIAYNFLIDRFGRIYEGRKGGMAKPVIGGHAMGFNTGSTGIAVIGDFTSFAPPTSVKRALKRLLAWRLDVAHLKPKGSTTMVSAGGSNQKYRKGEAVRLPIISGHRQTGYTACPGNLLWEKMGGIRKGAQRLGKPKVWNPRPFSATLKLGSSTVTYKAKLTADTRWVLQIRDPQGTMVKRFRGKGKSFSRTWDGTYGGNFQLPGGPFVPPGEYVALIKASSGGKDARPASIPTTVTLG